MNELNIKMKKIAEEYCMKNELEILHEDYRKYGCILKLKENIQNIESLVLNITENCRSNKLPIIYMKKKINGKQSRIPKKEW